MSGKSKEEVAFELVSKLKGVGVWGENNMVAILDMYSECLEATSGLRSVDGKTPSAIRLQGQNSTPAKAAPTPAVRQSAPIQQPPAQQPVPQQQRQPLQVAQPAYQQQRPQ